MMDIGGGIFLLVVFCIGFWVVWRFVPNHQKACRDCKYIRPLPRDGKVDGFAKCTRPIEPNAVTGSVVHDQYCDIERHGYPFTCGPRGRFWEPRP